MSPNTRRFVLAFTGFLVSYFLVDWLSGGTVTGA